MFKYLKLWICLNLFCQSFNLQVNMKSFYASEAVQAIWYVLWSSSVCKRPRIHRNRGIKFTWGAGEGFTEEVILSFVLKD